MCGFRESCNIDDVHVCACSSQQYKIFIDFISARAKSAVAGLCLTVGCCRIPCIIMGTLSAHVQRVIITVDQRW